MTLSSSLQECLNTSHFCPGVVDVFAQAPHYLGYVDIVGHIPNARWNMSADPASQFTIEILTYVLIIGAWLLACKYVLTFDPVLHCCG